MRYVQPSAAAAILMYNLVDFAAGSLAFGLIGYGIAFGTDSAGHAGSFAGAGAWMLVGSNVDYAEFFFQMSFCVTCVTILSGALAGRARFSRYVFIPFFISGKFLDRFPGTAALGVNLALPFVSQLLYIPLLRIPLGTQMGGSSSWAIWILLVAVSCQSGGTWFQQYPVFNYAL
jgi:hypothetical protein